MKTILDFQAEVEKRAEPRREADINRFGKTDGPRIEQECINEVVAEMLEHGREQLAAAALIERDYWGFWKDIPSALGTQSLLSKIANLYEKRNEAQNAVGLWQRLYRKRKQEFAEVLPMILDMRKQLAKKVQLDPSWVKGSENNFQAIKEYILAAADPYLSTLQRYGSRDEAQKLSEEIAAIKADKAPAPPPSARKVEKLDEEAFWGFIEEARKATDNDGEMVLYLTSLLETLPARQIIQFQKIFSRKIDQALRWDLWAVAFIMMGGCSDDSFEYFRAWLISRGRTAFERALGNPEDAAESVEPGTEVENESLLYAPLNAYLVRKPEDSDDFVEKTSRKEPAIRGTQWTESDLPKMFPKLCERFGFEV